MKYLFVLFVALQLNSACVVSKVSSTNQASPTPARSPANANGSDASNEAPCSLTLAQQPVVNGLKLGMAPDEVLSLFAGSQDDPEVKANLAKPPSEFGVSAFTIRPANFGAKQFTDSNYISFTLLDGRVMKFYIDYGTGQRPSVDKFIDNFVQGTNLPASDVWQAYPGMENQLKTLRCAEFEIRAFTPVQAGIPSYVEFHDLPREKILKSRIDKAHAKASPQPS